MKEIKSTSARRQFRKFCWYGFLKNLRLFDPFILLFLLENQLSYFYIGILFSVREMTTNFLEIPSGIIADSLGRRRALIFAMISYQVSFFLFYVSTDFWQFCLAMLLFGNGEAFRSGTHKAMVIRFLDKEGLGDRKTFYYGKTRRWSQMGSAMASLLALVVVFLKQDYRQVFLATLLPYLANALLIASYPREYDEDTGKAAAQNFSASLKSKLKSYRQAITERVVWRPVLSAGIFSGLYKGLKDYIQPLLEQIAVSLPVLLALADRQKTAVVLGVAYFLIYLISSQAASNAWRLQKKSGTAYRAGNGLYISTSAAVLLSGLILISGDIVPAVILLIILFIGHNLRRPVMLTIMSERIPASVMASGLSTESLVKTLTVALLSPLLGLLIDYYSFAVGLIVTGIFFLLMYSFLKLKPE